MQNKEVIDRRILGIIGTILAMALLSLFIASCSNQEDENLYRQGKANYKQKNYEAARKAFKELLEQFPNFDVVSSNEARRLIAQSYFDEGKEYYEQKKYEASRETFGELLKQFPNSDLKGTARLLIAHSYRFERNYNQAYLAFDILTGTEFDGSPEQEEAMYYAAYSLKSLKVYDEALVRYTEFLMRFPKSKYVSKVYFDRGGIYLSNKKDYVLARSNYDRALNTADNLNKKAKSQLGIGEAYFGQNVFQKALTALNVLLKEYPESEQFTLSRARFLIAHIYRREKEWDKTIAEYKHIINEDKTGESISIDGDDGLPQRINIIAFSYKEIGAAFFEKKDFEKAFKSFARIVQKPERDEQDFRTDSIAPYAMYQAMRALYELGRKDELETFATTYVNALRDNKPTLSAEAQFRFAEILRKTLEQYDKAATEYAKLQSYPPKPKPRLDLIKLKGKYYEGLCYNELSRLQNRDKAYQETITLFNTMFQPLIDIPNIKSSNISNEEFDYCIQTALKYAEKACAEIKDTEYTKKACAEIKEARRKLEDKDKTMQKSDASANPNSSAQSQTKEQLTPEQIAQKASSSTVFLTMDNVPAGSGFFVKPDQIATNYHVIEGTLRGTARLVGTDREYVIIGYTAIDPDRDLAILKVRAFGVKPLSLGDSAEVDQGEAVYPIGNPLGLVNVVSEGQISSIQWVKSIQEFIDNKSKLVKDFRRDETPQKLFMMTAPISGGNSGGPVLNGKGDVIGISVGSSKGQLRIYPVIDKEDQKIVPERYVQVLAYNAQNLNFAVPVNYLKALLNLVGPPKPLSDLEIIY